MADEGWEERMAARARERRLIRETEEYLRGMARYEVEHRPDLAHTAGWMTLGYAIDYLTMPRGGWVCACIGPPDCCRDRYEVALMLQRAAHIAVKLVQDYAESVR